MRRDIVVLEDLEVEAYIETDSGIQGWASPLFTKEEVEGLGLDEEYDVTTDCFVFKSGGYTDRFYGDFHEIDGKLVKLYPIGKNFWPWLLKSEVREDW